MEDDDLDIHAYDRRLRVGGAPSNVRIVHFSVLGCHCPLVHFTVFNGIRLLYFGIGRHIQA